jgi:hypothetical protein
MRGTPRALNPGPIWAPAPSIRTSIQGRQYLAKLYLTTGRERAACRPLYPLTVFVFTLDACSAVA